MAELIRDAGRTTVARLIREQTRVGPARVAIEGGDRRLTYGELEHRSRRLATLLASLGVGRGDRVALLSENRPELLELVYAAARLGAVVACQSWRLSRPEIDHCIDLVEPAAVVTSERHAGDVAAPDVIFGDDFERRLAETPPEIDLVDVDPEDPLLILYTSGTTGLPKGAVLSHRAEIARNAALRAELPVMPDDTFVAWSPLFHMGALEPSLGALMSGAKVIAVDGFDAELLADVVEREPLGWLLLMPGMVSRFADALEARGIEPAGVRVCGVMADLVPPAEIARITRLLGAPYANTFGATETGCPPASSGLIPAGVAPSRLSKKQSAFCEVRLIDADDREVADGEPGELCVRGPTLFSGYWREPEVNAADFRGGWFHMGDVFVRNPDGTLDFVDRVKYLIKSGGENIYPAEIERVLLADPRVAEAAVVRQADERWGEVPVAFVARRDADLDAAAVEALCVGKLARFKQPRRVVFIDLDDFPRSATGKIQRRELEARVKSSP